MADEPTLQERYEAALAELPPKQRKLVIEYLRDLHQRNAAIRAGYSEKTAEVQASQLLRKLKVQQAVNLGLQLHAMSADEVLVRLAGHARGSMDDFLDKAGDIDLARARELGKLHLVKSRSVTKEGERIELYDAQAALALLAKQHGLLKDRAVLTLESEIEAFLDLLKNNLPPEEYARVVALAAGGASPRE